MNDSSDLSKETINVLLFCDNTDHDHDPNGQNSMCISVSTLKFSFPKIINKSMLLNYHCFLSDVRIEIVVGRAVDNQTLD
jgi:hypothetical protein